MVYLQLERAAARHFHLRQQAALRSAGLTGECFFSQWATPAWRENADGTAEYSCDVFNYHIRRREEGCFCQIGISRLQVRAEADSPDVLTSIRYVPIQEMQAWQYAADPLDSPGNYPDLPAPRGGSPEELPALRNLQNLFFEHRLHRLEDLFSSDERAALTIEALDIDGPFPEANARCRALIRQEEERNRHCYFFVGAVSMPVIEVGAGGTDARGLTTALLYRVDAGDPENRILHREFASVETGFVKEAGTWKILTMRIRTLLPLPDDVYGRTGRYDRCSLPGAPWPVDQDRGTTPPADVAAEIENIIAGWAYGCRQGTLPAFVDTCMKNPQDRNRMWIRSFGDDTPVLDSLEKIREKISDMTSQYRDGYYTFHAPTTPVLLMRSDHSVRGTWYDCAATNLRSAAKSPEDVPYMTFVNKYCHDFEKIGGRWYLTSFRNEPVVSLPDWHLDMVHNTGYLANSRNRRFPDMFEEG